MENTKNTENIENIKINTDNPKNLADLFGVAPDALIKAMTTNRKLAAMVLLATHFSKNKEAAATALVSISVILRKNLFAVHDLLSYLNENYSEDEIIRYANILTM